ncbi:MAG TPA: pantoate--beta-alanine ligase [Candidatus Omnitrophica bacterium]|nr:MAG: pantoate--beta-alanine ligase [Omnitrophica WOR_2 bacterium GWA2_53_43]HBO97736.1 pantoate--beta-alanine ligase [Candidatus Omnitrophota bacterium]HCI45240.1 pantoate--beta-alanine ligase [Candidatus Omnitrophota bacterium]
MRVIRSVRSIQQFIKKAKLAGKTVGFVPTMGALHDGHRSLLRRCRRENDIVVLSVFVNPGQFGPKEDFAKYPRREQTDKKLAKKEKVDIMFLPSVKEMYPGGYLTYIDVEKMTRVLCGKSRPGHFKGVTTVVGKLLNIVMPDTLYLGQKDAQQAAALTRMTRDLNFPVIVKICPTVREADGLAMSSRNQYLTERARGEAAVLYRSLKEGRQSVIAGNHSVTAIICKIRSRITRESSGRIDYVECVDAGTVMPLKKIQGKTMIALAVWFGKTRLIDNIIVHA